MTALRLTILGAPRTKKNSLRRIARGRSVFTVPSKAFETYANGAMPQIRVQAQGKAFEEPVAVSCRYWIDANRRTDLVGLLQGTLDLLEDAGILADDSGWNPRIVARLDGSEIVGVDRKNPRVEITITPL